MTTRTEVGRNMGTRSMTYVLNERNQCLAAIYRQYDGYPRQPGMGYTLYDTLYNRTLCNGFSSKEDWQGYSNGIEDLAAFMVNRIKNVSLIGNIYLEVPPQLEELAPEKRYLRASGRNAKKHLAGYFYVVSASKNDTSQIHISVHEALGDTWKQLYAGDISGMFTVFDYHPPSNCGVIVEEPQI